MVIDGGAPASTITDNQPARVTPRTVDASDVEAGLTNPEDTPQKDEVPPKFCWVILGTEISLTENHISATLLV